MNTTLEHIERKAIRVPAGDAELAADLALPEDANGFVLFAHGSGSSRRSPRNRHVAHTLNRGFIGTLLIDLLTGDEEKLDVQAAQLRFDIGLLARRLSAITDWIAGEADLKKLRLGYFGASTGAAAALVAAAARPGAVHAVVSRGGRPDLAGDALLHVTAPSLFIVGGNDFFVLDLNREAMARLPPGTNRRLEIIPGASHLFEEPGALDRVAALARDWFRCHLSCHTSVPEVSEDCPSAPR
jgi:pimeloyl-ACP methyl ester carboxylesterase